MDGNIKTGLREEIDGFPMISWWQDEGLTLVMHVTVPETGATLLSTMGWAEHEKALANCEDAKVSTVQLLKKKLAAANGVEFNHWIKRIRTPFGDIHLTILRGPPTWWWPHADLRLPFWRGKGDFLVMVGWLRRAYIITYKFDRKRRG